MILVYTALRMVSQLRAVSIATRTPLDLLEYNVKMFSLLLLT